jgi:hypothetical protein
METIRGIKSKTPERIMGRRRWDWIKTGHWERRGGSP